MFEKNIAKDHDLDQDSLNGLRLNYLYNVVDLNDSRFLWEFNKQTINLY